MAIDVRTGSASVDHLLADRLQPQGSEVDRARFAVQPEQRSQRFVEVNDGAIHASFRIAVIGLCVFAERGGYFCDRRFVRIAGQASASGKPLRQTPLIFCLARGASVRAEIDRSAA
jgi:hypothetical protein